MGALAECFQCISWPLVKPGGRIGSRHVSEKRLTHAAFEDQFSQDSMIAPHKDTTSSKLVLKPATKHPIIANQDRAMSVAGRAPYDLERHQSLSCARSSVHNSPLVQLYAIDDVVLAFRESDQLLLCSGNRG